MVHNVFCQVDRAEALRYLGYAGQQVDESLETRFEATVMACEKDCSPTGVFAIFPLGRLAARYASSAVGDVVALSKGVCGATADAGSCARSVAAATKGASAAAESDCSRDDVGGVALAGTDVTLKGLDIARFLRDATHVALMAVTLGAHCERELRRLSVLNPTDALLYDAACSALVEAAANGLQERLCFDVAQRGFEVLPGRFSPGYGDLPLDVQKPLLGAIDAYRALGLAATESFLLVPRKSITAIVALRETGAECSGIECSGGAGHYGGAELAGDAACSDGAACAGGSSLAGAAAREGSGGSFRTERSSAEFDTCSTCSMADRCAYRRKGESCHGSYDY